MNIQTSNTNWGPDNPPGSAQVSDSLQTGLDSPISVFKPIVTTNPSEERTLSPPQCRLDYLLKYFGASVNFRLLEIDFFFHFSLPLQLMTWRRLISVFA